VTEKLDIWPTAQKMREMFGADAAIRSAMRADALMDQGDAEGFEMWRRVTAAINDLERKNTQKGRGQALGSVEIIYASVASPQGPVFRATRSHVSLINNFQTRTCR